MADILGATNSLSYLVTMAGIIASKVRNTRVREMKGEIKEDKTRVATNAFSFVSFVSHLATPSPPQYRKRLGKWKVLGMLTQSQISKD